MTTDQTRIALLVERTDNTSQVFRSKLYKLFAKVRLLSLEQSAELTPYIERAEYADIEWLESGQFSLEEQAEASVELKRALIDLFGKCQEYAEHLPTRICIHIRNAEAAERAWQGAVHAMLSEVRNNG